jgi:hypothetical protein
MKHFVAYRDVLGTLALSLVSKAFLLLFCSYAVAQDFSVAFRVTKIYPTVSLNGPITTIGIDPDNEQNVLVASESGGLFRSIDGALNWRHEDALPSNTVSDIAYLRRGTRSAIVTTAAGFEAQGGGVWIYEPARHIWTNLARDHSLFPASGPHCSATPGAYDISIAPDTEQIYIGTDCGVAIGSPDASSWRHVEIPGALVFPSITALAGGHLIVGGPSGVWYSHDDGVTWHRETTQINQILFIHGLSRDPRGGDRAYAVNEGRQLYETTNGGSSWSRITVNAERYNCGGIAFAKAVQQNSQVRLYFGDRCNTRVTSFNATSEPTTGTPVWSPITADHLDTRDLAFHPGTANPFLMSSDGGLENTGDGTNFHLIGTPEAGLDANQVTDISGQYIGSSSSPDMYFATWHNGVYGVGGSRTAGLCPEGWGFGVLRRVPTVGASKISVGCIGQNLNTDPLFENISTWPDNAQRLLPPVILAQGTYVQGIERTPEYPLRTRGLQYTTDSGATWRQIVDIREELRDRPRPAGPASDPTLIQAIHTDTTDGQQVIRLVRVSGFSSGATAIKRNAMMRGFGSIGFFATAVSYEVFAVDPNDATHIIAADGLHNNVQFSIDGGDKWNEIRGLTDLVSHHGEYLMGRPYVDRTESLVSSISFCPDNSSRVLIGTRQGGAYFSYDGGRTWGPVTGSDGIVNTTSFFWLNGCGSAWASTYGRGLWKINMTLQSPLSWTEFLCNHCPWETPTKELLRDEHPDPKSIQALLVLDGQVNSINQSGKTTIVSVSQGSALAKYGDLSNLKIDFEKDTDLPTPSLPKQSVIQGILFKNQKMSLITGASRLELYAKVPGKMGKGMAETPASRKPLIDVISKTRAFGTPAVMPGEPLIVQVTNLGDVQNVALVLQIDGKDAARVHTCRKVFEYVDRLTKWPMGRHVVALVTYESKRPRTVWMTNFLVPSDDRDLKMKKPFVPDTKPDTKQTKSDHGEKLLQENW